MSTQTITAGNNTTTNCVPFNGSVLTTGGWTGGTWVTGYAPLTIGAESHKYIVLNKEIETKNGADSIISMAIASINTVGIKFYIELKKQKSIEFPKEIKDFLDDEVISYNRDSKIEEIIK